MVKTMSEGMTFGYARVSTEDQDLSTQIDALTRYGVPRERIWFEKASGGSMKRVELSRLLKRLREGDSVVVWKLDRLGRTVSGVIDTAETMRAQGVNLVSITEHIDTGTAMGKLFFHIMAAFAQMERDLISERTTTAMQYHKSLGAKYGQPHSIAGNPKRLARFEELFVMGLIGGDGGLTNNEIRDHLNAADPKAKKIKAGETVRKWRSEGCPGAVLREPPIRDEVEP